MSKNRVEDIEIEKLAQGGDGLAHLPDGRVLFVPRALPGDVVDVAVVTDKKRWARAEVMALKKPSPARVSVECEAFDRGCGGCQFWGAQYGDELQWKVDAAWEAICRISGLELQRPQVVKAPSVRDYRSRVTLHQRLVDEAIRRGFYESGTRRIVEVNRCPVARPAIDEVMAEMGDVLRLWENADITIETAGDDAAVLLIELGKKERIKRTQLEELARRIEQATAAAGAEVVDELGNYYIIGDTTVAAEEVLARPPVEGLRLESGRFRQANRHINQRLVRYVVDQIESRWEMPRVVELYCGTGNFTFALAPVAETVMGFEASEGAVEAAREIAELSSATENLRFEVADLEDRDVVGEVLSHPFEVLVLDPPREGAAEVARQLAQSNRAGQVVYVSCDAACLARDLKTLAQEHWRVAELCAFDMFPRTAHLEMAAIIEK